MVRCWWKPQVTRCTLNVYSPVGLDGYRTNGTRPCLQSMQNPVLPQRNLPAFITHIWLDNFIFLTIHKFRRVNRYLLLCTLDISECYVFLSIASKTCSNRVAHPLSFFFFYCSHIRYSSPPANSLISCCAYIKTVFQVVTSLEKLRSRRQTSVKF